MKRPSTLADHLKRGAMKGLILFTLAGSAVIVPELVAQTLRDTLDTPPDHNVTSTR